MVTLPQGSEDSCLKAVGPKDHIIQGFWAILSLRVGFREPEYLLSINEDHRCCKLSGNGHGSGEEPI